MKKELDFETRQKILNGFYQSNRKSVKCRLAAAVVFALSWQLILRRKGFLLWMFLPGFLLQLSLC